jgi:hypothetical protein
MKQEFEDNKIHIAKAHAQGAAGHSTEIVIPRELCIRYAIDKEAHLILIPDEDGFTVRKLIIAKPGEPDSNVK